MQNYFKGKHYHHSLRKSNWKIKQIMQVQEFQCKKKKKKKLCKEDHLINSLKMSAIAFYPLIKMKYSKVFKQL